LLVFLLLLVSLLLLFVPAVSGVPAAGVRLPQLGLIFMLSDCRNF
jgi:hypothetical protein